VNVFEQWTNRWFGCWAEFGERYSACPKLEDFIDLQWQHPQIDKIITYLKNAPVVATTSRLAIPWARGDGDGRSVLSYRTDGVWLWLDDLDYYVLAIRVRLPDAFVKHIETVDFKFPAAESISPHQLQWPPIK
jgi:hypothetical protein